LHVDIRHPVQDVHADRHDDGAEDDEQIGQGLEARESALLPEVYLGAARGESRAGQDMRRP
jgi:hypothetical protein